MKDLLTFKSTTRSVILAALLVMVSCSQFDATEPALDNSETVEVTEANTNANFNANARISDNNVEPEIIPGANPGGNRTCEEVASHLGIEGFQYSSERINFEGGNFSGEFPEGFTIETDGTLVNWSYTPPPGYCLEAVAFIVKGSNDAHIYTYGPDIYSDSGLAAPTNASGDAAGLSNLTVCYTLRECVVEEEPCFEEETAWAAGLRYVTKGNWATYTTFSGEQKSVTLYAGQHHDIGMVTLTPMGGQVEIKIELNEMGMFQDNSENVKIQGYSAAPNKNPAPGQFTTHKGMATGSSYTVLVPSFAFYGIHVDAGRVVECEIE